MTAVAQKEYLVVVERCLATGGYVGIVPGFTGAHSQADTIDELKDHMKEVIAMLLEDGEPEIDSEFVGTITVRV